jgi:hypothetical protein
MSLLFVDTAVWMAAADAADPLHGACCAARDAWLEAGGTLITTNHVVDETLTLIRLRLGLQAAERWWSQVSESQRCRFEWITPERELDALNWFFTWKDQAFSFTDCTSFAVMRDLHLEKAMTSDRHFLTKGLEPLPVHGRP